MIAYGHFILPRGGLCGYAGVFFLYDKWRETNLHVHYQNIITTAPTGLVIKNTHGCLS